VGRLIRGVIDTKLAGDGSGYGYETGDGYETGENGA